MIIVIKKVVEAYFTIIKFLQFHLNCFFPKSGSKYDVNSVKRLTEFFTRCRQQMTNAENLFWVSLQSNLLADLSTVEKDFENAVKEMTEEMKENGWILPTLKANMRNQVNIANVQVKQFKGHDEMQSSIIKLPSGSSLIGEVPLLFNVKRVE